MNAPTLRRKARETAFQFLYQWDLSRDEGTEDLKDQGIQNKVDKHFAHFEIPQASRDFARTLIVGTLHRQGELDDKIKTLAVNWKVNRMAIVDRNLLRMALFELLHCDDIPPSVTLDEAIEMAKQFGTAETAPFLNGILDAAVKTLVPAKA